MGAVNIMGDVSGSIDITGDLTGTLDIAGDLSGDVSAGKLDDTAGDVSGGHINVDGSLTSTGSVTITTAFSGTSTEYVSIDYDGWDDGDTWESGGTVTVDSNSYTGNTPSAHVWEIQPCKGDMNNDATVNLFDIDPFVAGLAGGGPGEAYDLAYPGLLGSLLHHGDMNCDDSFDNFDINPFVLRVTDDTGEAYWTAHPACDPCEQPPGDGLGGGGGTTGTEFAAILEEYVNPELMPFVIDIAEQLAAESKNASRAQFWSDVYDALVE